MDGWNSDKLSFYLAPFPRYSVRRSIGTKSLYLATPLVFNSPPPRRRGSLVRSPLNVTSM